MAACLNLTFYTRWVIGIESFKIQFLFFFQTAFLISETARAGVTAGP